MPVSTSWGAPHDPAGMIARQERLSLRRSTLFEDSRTAWRLWGRGPTLVLIHGGHGTWLHWIKVIEPLAEHVQVACMDLPSFGQSEALPDPANPPRLAAALAAGIDSLFGRDSCVHLFGFSFGGVVAGYLARALGGRALSLGLVASGGLGGERLDLPMRSRARDMSDAEITEVHRHNLRTLMMADPARVDDLATCIQQRNTATRPNLVSRTFSRTSILSDVLSQVRCPVLGIWGDRDATVGPFLERRIATLAAAAPNAEVRIIPDCGHWVMYEQPAAFLAISTVRLSPAPRGRKDS